MATGATRYGVCICLSIDMSFERGKMRRQQYFVTSRRRRTGGFPHGQRYLKGALPGDRVTLQPPLFQTNDENRAMSDPTTPAFRSAPVKYGARASKRRLPASSPADGTSWPVMRGRKHAMSKRRKRSSEAAFRRTPPSTASSSGTTYHRSADMSRVWSLGGGLEYNSGVYSESGAVKW